MTVPSLDHLRKLFENIRTIGFWERLFRWRKIKDQLIDAGTDLQKILLHTDHEHETLAQFRSDFAIQAELISSLRKRKEELELELSGIKNDNRHFQDQLQETRSANTRLVKEDEFRKQEHSTAIASLNNFQKDLRLAKDIETEDKNKAALTRIFKLKETWSNHQELVKNTIKNICSKHTIEYMDKVPFKGEPDNTLKICGEFVILDAKSPAGEDLNNFPYYLKDQAERAKKYTKELNVKKDVFLVVPTNTLEKISQFVYKMGDYNVFIVSLDTLEPLIICLQKIEDYEFLEQLSPEDRENICRVLGKFAHLAKRRIQIDTFFIKQFMELSYKCESDLPTDILEKVVEYEKSEKLNPPTEKRAKQISLKELETDTTRLRNETQSKGIAGIEELMSAELNKLPLYTEGF
ncbi:MAG: hypothetical protein ABI415_08410 [Flavitalea sp.]